MPLDSDYVQDALRAWTKEEDRIQRLNHWFAMVKNGALHRDPLAPRLVELLDVEALVRRVLRVVRALLFFGGGGCFLCLLRVDFYGGAARVRAWVTIYALLLTTLLVVVGVVVVVVVVAAAAADVAVVVCALSVVVSAAAFFCFCCCFSLLLF